MIGESDHQLLRRLAPILRFDDRELFFPTSVDAYVAASCLHAEDGDLLLAEDDISLDALDDRWGGANLRFVSDEDRRNVVADEARRFARKLLTPRLGRVGLFGRILDALFLLTNLFRPLTPRLTTTAAALKAERLGMHDEAVVYGRVVRSGDWVVLHYAFFYVMNDWRSGYHGLNDHEADWEQAWVYLDPADLSPQWVAASSHDFSGADLRRHWDDPEVTRSEGRPVLFPGGGSHALYFRPGDYVSRLDVPALRIPLRIQAWARRALGIRDEATERGLGPALGAPFVDAATGDGRVISDWRIESMDDGAVWCHDFRGLWGLDTHDPAGGERGPSGPKFDRRGDVRSSWADPVGFAGLHGTPPPSLVDESVDAEKLALALDDLDHRIARRELLLPLAAHTGDPDEMVEESRRLTELKRQRTELSDLGRRLRGGSREGVTLRSHLHHPAVPLPPPRESGFVLAIWAALSIPLLMATVAAVLVFERLEFVGIFLGTVAVVSVAEQLVRRRYRVVLRLVGLYALIVLFAVFVAGIAVVVGRYAFGAALAVGAVVLFVANLGELRAAQHHRSAAAEAQRRSAAKG